MSQSSMLPIVDMNLFQNQRPPLTQPPGAFMVNQFGSYVLVTSFIPTNNEDRSQDHSDDTSSHGSTSNKMLVNPYGKE